MIRNYIFDFDGTIMDTAPVILIAMHATIEDLGLPPRTDAECLSTIGLVLKDIPGMLFPDLDLDLDLFCTRYQDLFRQNNVPGLAKPFPNTLETLRFLHEQGHGLAIASSRRHASLEKFVDGLGISELFSMLVAGDDVKYGKPSPEPVNTILDEMEWLAEETLVVGDAGFDILMGNAAGTLTCAVTYGNGTPEELAAAKPDYIIDDFGKICEIGLG